VTVMAALPAGPPANASGMPVLALMVIASWYAGPVGVPLGLALVGLLSPA